MHADCASAPIGARLLSRLDLSNDENVRDAAHELRRCATDAGFAAWARKWGGVALEALTAGPSRGDIEESEEYLEVTRALDALCNAATATTQALEKIARGDIAPSLEASLDEIIGDLDRAVSVAQ